MTAQTFHTFVSELKQVGISVPDETYKIVIPLKADPAPTQIVFYIYGGGDPAWAMETKYDIVSSIGFSMTSSEFLKRLPVFEFPPGSVKEFTITAEIHKAVQVDVTMYLPENSIQGFKDCRITRRVGTNERQFKIMAAPVMTTQDKIYLERVTRSLSNLRTNYPVLDE